VQRERGYRREDKSEKMNDDKERRERRKQGR
jgi:hypothetical protein